MSAFKTLFTDMVNNGGDFSKLSKDFTKQQLKVFVKETQPYFLVSDSFFFVPAYFTKAALEDFEKKFANVKVQDLLEKVVLISSWSLELKKVDSNAVFTSYAGLEVRLIINQFKPQLGESLHPTRWPTNLYRDDEFKTTIQALRHRHVQDACAKVPIPDASAAGIVKSNGDDWHFKEGNTAVVTLGSGKARPATSAAKAVVKGGAKRGAKAVKSSGKSDKGKALSTVEKVMKFTPHKKPISKGKQSTSGKKPVASPGTGGKKSAAGTTDHMTMHTLKKFIKYQKDNGKKASVLKKNAGKKSTTKA